MQAEFVEVGRTTYAFYRPELWLLESICRHEHINYT